MLKKVLIANRGEIALRITRCCKELGIKTVAVYSLEDSNLLHLRLADEAICIGGLDSYNNIQTIINAAKISGADSIHPGYGFLSENPYFARIAKLHGLTFIGSSYRTTKAIGDKAHASELLSGFNSIYKIKSHPIYLDKDFTLKLAEKIGYPILIKSSNSGGGKNIYVSYTEQDLIKSIKTLEIEIFKSPLPQAIFMEKLIKNARHIEFQIISDGKGNAVHLGERDCSVQHSYKKIIEESPAINISQEQRSIVGNFCKKICKRISYEGVGTFEFLYSNKKFYFIEMNPRIQVEHTVTEAVTGIDIVKEQIRIASGKRLELTQKDVKFTGHAIECRINMENANNYFSSSRKVKRYHQPGGPGIRIDSHLYSGYEIQSKYDSLLAKVITYGENRQTAISKMKCALDEVIVEGIPTNTSLHKIILEEKAFVEGLWSTEILDENSVNYV